MSRFGFVGPTYASQSSAVDAQRTINWYPEADEGGSGKAAMSLYPTPGLKTFSALANETKVPQVYNANGRFFAIGNHLHELSSAGVDTDRGALLAAADRISVAYNPQQMLINCIRTVDGTTTLYLFTFSTNTLTIVNQANLRGPFSSIGFTDGYFVGLVQNSNIFQISALEDGATWNLLDVAQVSVFPDNIVAMLIDHREIWFWGISKSTVYYNSGDPDFPFAPIPGAYLEQGIGIANSAVRLDNSVFWVGQDERGALIGWRAAGYTPQRVTNHAVEYAWSQYANTSDVTSYPYQDQGHSFWVINFPSANNTWVYDVSTGMWHERSYLNPITGQPESHRACCHAYGFGKHLVGDRASGTVYDMSINYVNDFGSPIRRLRRAPYIATELQWIRHFHMQVDMEVGVGPIPPLSPGEAKGYAWIVLEDSSGVLWKVTIDDGGLLHTDAAVVTDGVVKTIVLADQVDGFFYQLGVNVDGTLRTDPVGVYTYQPQSTYYMKTSGTGLQSGIQVSGGVLQTIPCVLADRPPYVMLRFSDNNCKTWSNERRRSAGYAGEYKIRVHWYRLGRSRGRVYEISCSDPVFLRIADAYLEADPGFGPQERLSAMFRKSS